MVDFTSVHNLFTNLMSTEKSPYRRIMLKLSGEVLAGQQQFGIDGPTLEHLAKSIQEVTTTGVQVALVLGGGNFWRFRDQKELHLDRTISDSMGMIATVMNAVAMQEKLKSLGVRAKAFSALPIPSILDTYAPQRAREAFTTYDVVLCAGGTGSPYFTTDSAAALRALELQCDVFLKATKVDYVCDKDPNKHTDAKIFTTVSYQQVLELGLEVMDLTAVSLCMDNKLPIIVFNMQKDENLMKVICGKQVGTTIS